MSLDRLHELSSDDSDIAPSEIELHGTKYIRCEYFADGQRRFFTPLDLALNGPDEGSVMERSDKRYGHCKVKIIEKHYEHGSDVPSFMECEVKKRSQKHKLWVIVKVTELVREKFRFANMTLGFGNGTFVAYPDLYLRKKLRMDNMSPYNDACIAFSIVTGIPLGMSLREDLV